MGICVYLWVHVMFICGVACSIRCTQRTHSMDLDLLTKAPYKVVKGIMTTRQSDFDGVVGPLGNPQA